MGLHVCTQQFHYFLKISCGLFLCFWPAGGPGLTGGLTAVAFNPFLCIFFGLLQAALENTSCTSLAG